MFHNRTLFLDAFFVIVSVFLMGIFANIQIPLWPVPITMQTFGIFMIAFFFGSLRGTLTIAAYLLAGLIGFGVFAGHSSGLAPFIGPTAGYLIGFVFMTLAVGLMIERGYGRSRKSILICMLTGEVVLYAFGLAGLWLYLGDVSFFKVLQLGLMPFIIGDALKALLAIVVFPYAWKGAQKLTQSQ